MTSHNTEKTIVAYDRNADSYTEKFKDYEPYKAKIVEFQNLYMAKGAKVLDLGCGPGNNIAIIKALDSTCSFTGVDLSPRFLDIARANHPEAIFIQQNICDPPGMERYDVVLASFCIVHLSNVEMEILLRNVSNSLVTGGLLYLSFMEGEGCGFESTSFSNDEIFFNYYTREDVESFVCSNGMKVVSLQTADYQEDDGSTTTDVFIYAVKG